MLIVNILYTYWRLSLEESWVWFNPILPAELFAIVGNDKFRDVLLLFGFDDRLRFRLQDESQIRPGIAELLDDAVLCAASCHRAVPAAAEVFDLVAVYCVTTIPGFINKTNPQPVS